MKNPLANREERISWPHHSACLLICMWQGGPLEGGRELRGCPLVERNQSHVPLLHLRAFFLTFFHASTTGRSLWWSNHSHFCCLRESLSLAPRADESKPFPPLRCHMTGEKQFQRSADPLRPQGNFLTWARQPSVLLWLMTCQSCLGPAHGLAHVFPVPDWTPPPTISSPMRQQERLSVAQRGRVVRWLGAWPWGCHQLLIPMCVA
jgi:hypothetical protein